MIPQFRLLCNISSLRLSSWHSSPVLTKSTSDTAHASLPRPHLQVSEMSSWATFLLVVAVRWVFSVCVCVCVSARTHTRVHVRVLSYLFCPLKFQSSPQTCLWQCFLLCGNFSSFMTPSPICVSFPKSFVSVFVFCIFPTSFWRDLAAFLGAWCPLPVLRSCFEEVAQHSNDLLLNLLGRKQSPHPIRPRFLISYHSHWKIFLI